MSQEARSFRSQAFKFAPDLVEKLSPVIRSNIRFGWHSRRYKIILQKAHIPARAPLFPIYTRSNVSFLRFDTINYQIKPARKIFAGSCRVAIKICGCSHYVENIWLNTVLPCFTADMFILREKASRLFPFSGDSCGTYSGKGMAILNLYQFFKSSNFLITLLII